MCLRGPEGQALGSELDFSVQVEGGDFPGLLGEHMVLTLCFTLSITEVGAEVQEGGSSSRLPG